ncbi:MAG: glycosyl hydrolase, partial [Bacteroidota bacterium]|nr:glycosyl hydrolase [Bacteroidota bacterium]
MKIDYDLEPGQLLSKLNRFWSLSGEKIKLIESEYDPGQGSPVFTVNGLYSTRGWTEWTRGFQYGSSLLQFDASGDEYFLEYGREHTRRFMAPHVSHSGVHDHGFNNVSTYGNLLRLMLESKIPEDRGEKDFYELALKISGAVQAMRWTTTKTGGFIYSFNGPHSLFVDTIRTIRVLMLSHLLGHVCQGEGDVKIDLLGRAIQHARATADYSIYYGNGRDGYDVRGRCAHESIFNVNDGSYRCPNAQQGFSGYTTWTRGLAWAMCGFAEELEFFELLPGASLEPYGGKKEIELKMLEAAMASCDFFIDNTPQDGIPYWDTGAPNLHKIEKHLEKNADPFNAHEPVDSSAAAIGAQGLLRLGRFLEKRDPEKGQKYWQAGLTVMNTLLDEPYLSTEASHQGILLNSIYHEPNAWDHKPDKELAAHGESSMWGDYH